MVRITAVGLSYWCWGEGKLHLEELTHALGRGREGVERCAVQISWPGLPYGHSAPSLDAAPADQTGNPLQVHPGGLILSPPHTHFPFDICHMAHTGPLKRPSFIAELGPAVAAEL